MCLSLEVHHLCVLTELILYPHVSFFVPSKRYRLLKYSLHINQAFLTYQEGFYAILYQMLFSCLLWNLGIGFSVFVLLILKNHLGLQSTVKKNHHGSFFWFPNVEANQKVRNGYYMFKTNANAPTTTNNNKLIHLFYGNIFSLLLARAK